jgi:predicted RNase H-like HicB family nuclease
MSNTEFELSIIFIDQKLLHDTDGYSCHVTTMPEVMAEGKTVEEAEANLMIRLSDYFKRNAFYKQQRLNEAGIKYASKVIKLKLCA